MGHTLLHGDDRIEKNLECGTGDGIRMQHSHRGREMTSGRSPRDSDSCRVAAPFLSVRLQDTHTLLRILEWNLAVSSRHTVFKHCIGNSTGVEPWSHIMPFVACGKMSVSSPGTHHHYPPVGTVSRIDRKQSMRIGDY